MNSAQTFEIKPMHLTHAPAQTTTATFPGPNTLDFVPDACRPRALTQHPLDIPAPPDQTKEVLKATYLESLKDIKSKAEILRQSVVGLLALIERQIRDLYGERTFKFLRAASHIAKARDEGELPVQQIPE